MPQQPLRIGIVGAGANTCARHIPGLQVLPDVEIAAVANRTLESSRRVTERFGIPRACGSWQEVVMAADVDAVVIGTWPSLHAEVTCAALALGKHVLCEARMARDLAEARAMLAASRQHPDRVAQLVPSPFTLGVDATIRRFLAEGRLGRLLCVDVTDHGAGFVDYGTPLHWREDRALSGLNIMSLGIWYEALMRWTGTAESVQASGATLVPERRDAQTGDLCPVRVPDWLAVTARLRNGAMAQFSLRKAGGLLPRRECVLTGDEGALRFDGERLWFGSRAQVAEDPVPKRRRPAHRHGWYPGSGEPSLQRVLIPDHEHAEWRVEADFVDAIRTGAPVRLTSFADGVRYMAFTQAVAESLASGRTERVDKGPA